MLNQLTREELETALELGEGLTEKVVLVAPKFISMTASGRGMWTAQLRDSMNEAGNPGRVTFYVDVNDRGQYIARF